MREMMPVVVLFLVVIVLLFLVLPVITVILVNALGVMGVILGPSVPGHTVLLCIVFATRNFSTLEKATRILLHLGKRTCENSYRLQHYYKVFKVTL